MNTDIIMQIVEESKTIPDNKWGFPGHTYQYRKTAEREEISPIWRHVLNHPELVKQLRITTGLISLPPHHKNKRFTTGEVDEDRLMEYLDLTRLELRYLFSHYEYSKHRQCFINTVVAFVNGEIEIRTCGMDECGVAYSTTPDDKACVCPECKEDLMAMCGL